MPPVNAWHVERNVAPPKLATTTHALSPTLVALLIEGCRVGGRADKAGPVLLSFGYEVFAGVGWLRFVTPHSVASLSVRPLGKIGGQDFRHEDL